MIADLIKPAPVQPTSGLKLTLLIHKSYNISGQNVIEERYHASRSAVQVNLDNESNALHRARHPKPESAHIRPLLSYRILIKKNTVNQIRSQAHRWIVVSFFRYTGPNGYIPRQISRESDSKQQAEGKSIDDSELPS